MLHTKLFTTTIRISGLFQNTKWIYYTQYITEIAYYQLHTSKYFSNGSTGSVLHEIRWWSRTPSLHEKNPTIRANKMLIVNFPSRMKPQDQREDKIITIPQHEKQEFLVILTDRKIDHRINTVPGQISRQNP